MGELKEILRRLYAGDRGAAARLITVVENRLPDAEKVMEDVSKRTGNALRIGVTGPSGVGKSTLVDFFVKRLLEKGKRVGIVAVDPSSPFSGGALLGDRVRMREIATDENVFIRSMASRGRLGGLSEAAIDCADILDAMGCDIVVTETVGVGQAEVEIAQVSDICILVLSPESGDAVQTLKAGLMEIADVYVVNKSDREGADRLYREIEFMLQMQEHSRKRKVPVLLTEARTGKGIDELVEVVESYLSEMDDESVRRNRLRMAEYKILALLDSRMRRLLAENGALFEKMSKAVAEGKMSAHKAADEILSRLLEE